MTPPPTGIELFCGCGGMSTGLLDAGIAIKAGFDHDRSSIKAFDYNHSYRGCAGHLIDLAGATSAEILDGAGMAEVDLVSGGPPCQPFSVAGRRRGLEDRRGNLVFEYLRLIGELRPEAAIFENVPNLARLDEGRIVRRILEELRSFGYGVSAWVLSAADYGVPQTRKRLVIVGLRGWDDGPPPPSPTHSRDGLGDLFSDRLPYVTAREAIGDLPDVNDPAAAAAVPNHEPTFHTPEMLASFAVLEPGRRDRKSFHDRLHPERPSYTLRAGYGNYSPLRPVHYECDRVVTVRESARLQGFSDEFIWPDSIPRLQQYRQVGNAVPPPLARVLGRHVGNLLGWSLDADCLRGDPGNRPPAFTMTFEERIAARQKYMHRGASLGSRSRSADSAAPKPVRPRVRGHRQGRRSTPG